MKQLIIWSSQPQRNQFLQLNLSTTAILETEESRRCKEVAVVDRFKQESMYGLSAKKVAVVERWSYALVEVRLYITSYKTR